MSSLVMTSPTAPWLRECCDCPMPSRMTFPPPNFTSSPYTVKCGGGKVIRDGMGQSQHSRSQGAVDTVITNALILDHWGIVKADIGLKDGRIAAIGKAGNPDVQPNVTIIIGPGTEVIGGEGMVVTAGGIDVHVHYIC